MSIDFNRVLQDPSLWENISHDNNNLLGHGNPDFLYGVGTSMYQDSGAMHCPDSQWSAWEKQHLSPPEQSGASADLFALYKNDPLAIIEKLKLLGVNTYRFSLEWSHLEPAQGMFDREKLQSYLKFCRLLRDHHIQPFITLHHFSEPDWFHQLGSFEKTENIAHFRDFCRVVFEELIQTYQGKPLVQFFCTINEPGVDAYGRYLIGYFPPNLRGRVGRSARFLMNMLHAHCQVYDDLKSIAGRDASNIKIGINHQYLQFYPTNFLMRPAAKLLNKFNVAVLNFFKTGRFEFKIPFICNVIADSVSKPKTDFVGVQFYARIFLGFKGAVAVNKPATSMLGVYEDPEGLYEAIVTCFEAFNVPVIISENGISTQSDEQRARYLSRAFYAAEQAQLKIGADNMWGYILWSFTDNFEWFLGWTAHFGAFGLTSNRELNENYKLGTTPFVEKIKAWSDTLTTDKIATVSAE